MAIRSGHSRSSRLVSVGNPYHREVQHPNNNGRDGCRLYIGNLAWDVKWQHLKDYFGTVGRVVRADVEEEGGKSKGWGIVEYSTPMEATEAMTRLNDTELMGRPVHVREDREAGGRSAGSTNRVVERGDRMAPGSARPRPSATGCKVYVGNLSWEVKWQHLKDFFKTVGFVVKADVMEEPDTGRSKGCGIVEFSSPLDAQRAINQLNDTPLMGRLIFVREDREEGDSRGFDNRGPSFRQVQQTASQGQGQGQVVTVGCRIYVGNLSWDVKWQDLKDFFKPCGTVVRADVMEEPGGRSKGCGIVEFSTPQEAQRAMTELNDTEFMGRQVFIREDREEGGAGGNRQMAGNPMQMQMQHMQQPVYQHPHQHQYPQQQMQQQAPLQMQPVPYERPERPPRQTVAPGEGRRIYVGNLSWEVKWQDLKDFFKPCGTVVRADVMEEPGGRSKGCGLVEFSTPQEAQRAMTELNDTEFMGRQVFIREDREEGGAGR